MKKRLLRRLLWCAAGLVTALLLVLCGTNAYMWAVTHRHMGTVDTAPQAQCILVLGAGVRDGKPTPMLQDRLDCALALYQKGVAPKILLSGDHGRVEYDEVNVMRTYLLARGVPAENLFMDHAGFNTYATMVRAKRVFCVQSAVVVTQQYHLYRALFNAQQQGITAYGVDCTLRRPRMLPYYVLRECAARSKDFFACTLFRPDPQYLGDPIPIEGDGRLTQG